MSVLQDNRMETAGWDASDGQLEQNASNMVLVSSPLRFLQLLLRVSEDLRVCVSGIADFTLDVMMA